MKLFMVHVGFYDDEVGEGIYESHVNFFIAAGNVKSAKKKIMSMDKFRNKTDKELKDWWKEILPTLEYNQKTFINMGNKKTKKIKLLENIYD